MPGLAVIKTQQQVWLIIRTDKYVWNWFYSPKNPLQFLSFLLSSWQCKRFMDGGKISCFWLHDMVADLEACNHTIGGPL